MNLLRFSVVASLLATTALACGGPEEEALGKARSAASADYFLKIEGVPGESSADRRRGHLFSWSPNLLDETATAEVIVDCSGVWCELATVEAVLQSGPPTADGPTSVWQVVDGPNQPLVVRDAKELGAIEARRIDVSAWNPNATSSGNPWSTMALDLLVNCSLPAECAEVPAPEGWMCLPVCSLDGNKDL
jgi:hypothetical protein